MKFPAFHGTGKFITSLTSFRHLSLSRARPIQSIYPNPTSWRSILILSTYLRQDLPNGFPTKILYTPSPQPYAPYAQPITFFLILITAKDWVRCKNHLASLYAIPSTSPYLVPPRRDEVWGSGGNCWNYTNKKEILKCFHFEYVKSFIQSSQTQCFFEWKLITFNER